MSRLTPPSEPYSAELSASLAKWLPPGFPHDPLLIFRVLHLHPELAARMRVVGAGLLAHGRLPARDREVVIARVTARVGAQYEWGVHAAYYGPRVEFTDEHIADTVNAEPDPALWTDAELTLMRAVDELDGTADLGESTWSDLRAHYDDQQLIELIVLTGWYRMVGYLCTVLQLESEPWATAFPTDPPG